MTLLVSFAFEVFFSLYLLILSHLIPLSTYFGCGFLFLFLASFSQLQSPSAEVDTRLYSPAGIFE